jgi:putative spermidine/putrescine transport system permease protein
MSGPHSRRAWALLVGAAWVVLLYLMLPTLVAIPVSLTPNRYLSMPDGAISFRHYAALLSDESWRNSVLQSLAIGSAVTLIATSFGTFAAIGMWRLSSLAGETARLIALSPLIVPQVVTALAFYKTFAGLGLNDTFTGVILAHSILASPFVIVTVAASLAANDLRQEQASRSLGASSLQTIRHVILPQILPGVLTGAVFAFLTSWDEIVVTLFLASREVYTLPRKMWDGLNENIDPTIASAATVMFAVTLLLIGLQALRGAGSGARSGLADH